jgi:hypothetical protein
MGHPAPEQTEDMWREDGAALCGQDRRSRAERSCEDRLRRVLTHCVAETGIPGPAWFGTARQDARPQGSGAMSKL